MIMEDFHQVYNLAYSSKPLHLVYLQKLCLREGEESFSQQMLKSGCECGVPRERVTDMLLFIKLRGVWVQ
jgi:hypothetical protein